MSTAAPSARDAATMASWTGRPFVSAAFDYLLIGGGLSLVVLAAFWAAPEAATWAFLRQHVWTLVLFSNSAHFAGSTVRLYTKAGSFRDLPFVTMVLPLVMLLALAGGLLQPALGAGLVNVYLLWSPFHYAAQTYGLSVMYACRAGRAPTLTERRLLRASCLVPFLHTTLGGLGDFLVPSWAAGSPVVQAVRQGGQTPVAALAVALPLATFLYMLRRQRPMPAIVPLLVASNAAWLIFAGYSGAFAVALVTVFHGLQYLAILCVFHAREQAQGAGSARPAWHHVFRFYLLCLALGYLLFQALPGGMEFLGATHAESVLLVVAVINLHHFLVDGFIWKLRRDPNYAVVTGEPAPA